MNWTTAVQTTELASLQFMNCLLSMQHSIIYIIAITYVPCNRAITRVLKILYHIISHNLSLIHTQWRHYDVVLTMFGRPRRPDQSWPPHCPAAAPWDHPAAAPSCCSSGTWHEWVITSCYFWILLRWTIKMNTGAHSNPPSLTCIPLHWANAYKEQ